jgi:hypothetical protein
MTQAWSAEVAAAVRKPVPAGRAPAVEAAQCGHNRP